MSLSTPLHTLVNPPNGQIDFSVLNHYFIPWVLNVERKLNAIGAVDVLKESYICIRKPSVTSDPAHNDGNIIQLTTHSERGDTLHNSTSPINDDSSLHLYQYMKQQALFGQVLEIVMSSLTITHQVSSVMPIFTDNELDGRLKAIKIVQHFRKLYGSVAPHNIEPIAEEMNNIPSATDSASAQNLISSLTFWNCCLRSIHPSVELSDEALLSKLKEKLTGNMFAYVTLMMNCRGTKFSDAATQVCNTVSLYQRRVHQQRHNTASSSSSTTIIASTTPLCSSAHKIDTRSEELLDDFSLHGSVNKVQSSPKSITTLADSHSEKVHSAVPLSTKKSSSNPSDDVSDMQLTLSLRDKSTPIFLSTDSGDDVGGITKPLRIKRLQPPSRVSIGVVSDDENDVDDDGNCFAW